MIISEPKRYKISLTELTEVQRDTFAKFMDESGSHETIIQLKSAP